MYPIYLTDDNSNFIFIYNRYNENVTLEDETKLTLCECNRVPLNVFIAFTVIGIIFGTFLLVVIYCRKRYNPSRNSITL